MTQSQVFEKMTPEQRLKQAEILLGTAAKRINENTETAARIDEQLVQLNLQMNHLANIVAELATFTRQNHERMEQNSQEIRRIWEYLLSRSDNGHSNSPNS